MFLQIFYANIALILILIGLYCIASKRNLLKIIIGIEIITVSVNLNILAMGLREAEYVDPLAQEMTIISIAIGAAVAAIALCILLNVFRHYKTLDTRKLKRLRW
ncbi:MAG: cation:proton antiporter [Thermoprotei archaeon]|nr:MAG: cation:proton antiporter [Thermoprotei archaeon]